MMQSANAFSLNPDLDVEIYRAKFLRTGRIAVRELLPVAEAQKLLADLKARTDWLTVFNVREKTYELSRAGRAEIANETWQTLNRILDETARWGFQYRYETLRVPDAAADRTKSVDLLTAFASFLSSQPVLSFLRRVTDSHDIVYADAQATCYTAGDFLTRHDDDVPGKHRRAAYVLGLSEVWRPEWGGLLLFHHSDNVISEVFTPSFNTLNVFRVPMCHSVSQVSASAGAPRFSITGWLRHREPGHMPTG